VIYDERDISLLHKILDNPTFFIDSRNKEGICSMMRLRRAGIVFKDIGIDGVARWIMPAREKIRIENALNSIEVPVGKVKNDVFIEMSETFKMIGIEERSLC